MPCSPIAGMGASAASGAEGPQWTPLTREYLENHAAAGPRAPRSHLTFGAGASLTSDTSPAAAAMPTTAATGSCERAAAAP